MPTVAQLQAVENPSLTIPGLELPPGMEMRPYQKVDAVYLLLRRRAILAEYPAAGKKLICIAGILKAFHLRKAVRALVVSLGTDVEQWVEEIDMCTDKHIRCETYRGTPKDRRYKLSSLDADIWVSTYNTAAADAFDICGAFDIIIFDECSAVKTPDTSLAQHLRIVTAPTPRERIMAAVDIKKKVGGIETEERRYTDAKIKSLLQCGPTPYAVWGASATPYETSPLDIFSLLWILKGRESPLGINQEFFKKRFCEVQKFKVKVKTQKGNRHIRIEKVKRTRPEMKDSLRDLIKEDYIRHPFSIVEPYLPSLQVLPIMLNLGNEQVARYKEIAEGKLIADFIFRDRGKRVSEKEITAAIKLFYLLRCCDGLTSLPGQKSRQSVKYNWTMNMLLTELSDEKVMVYSRFHQPLNDLEKGLNDEGIPWVRIDGERDDDQNDLARRSFNTDEPGSPRVLLVTSKAERALNITVCRYGIAYNRKHNPKAMEQLHGRIRRPGKHSAVFWYHPICKATAEEKQWQILSEREAEASDLGFMNDEDVFTSLTPEEQAEVMSYGLGGI